MVNIQVVSDLHLEAYRSYDLFEIEPTAPYLALLGDIGNTRDSGLYDFLRSMLEKFEVVFFVAGNHEPYHSDWPTARKVLTDFATEVNAGPPEGSGKFVFLDQTRYDLSDKVTILGCVLYSAVDEENRAGVSMSLNDFYQTKNWTIEDHCNAHASDLEWLNSQISEVSEKEPQRRIAVFTHHSPTTAESTLR